MHKSFIQFFLKNQILSLFPLVKVDAKYAEIGRVGKLVASFQQTLLI